MPKVDTTNFPHQKIAEEKDYQHTAFGDPFLTKACPYFVIFHFDPAVSVPFSRQLRAKLKCNPISFCLLRNCHASENDILPTLINHPDIYAFILCHDDPFNSIP